MKKAGKELPPRWMEHLIYRARLVGEAAENNLPPRSAVTAVALLVVAARQVYGRELVDEAIEEKQAETTAVLSGLCLECKTKPVTEKGYDIWCSECGAKYRADEAREILESFDEKKVSRN